MNFIHAGLAARQRRAGCLGPPTRSRRLPHPVPLHLHLTDAADGRTFGLPEPSAICLMSLGAIGLLARRRKA